ncbi:MAG: hypothetical protein WCT28_02275 [Patescibacteria group bacterium]|jgi:hypothetical protein
MANNHFSRLLRLARKTGDRIIVTDEEGKEEPLVILPLNEYELLIDGALEMGELQVSSEGATEEQMEVAALESWMSESKEDEIEDIQIEDAPIASGDEIEESVLDEADVDEEALKSLWTAPEVVEIKEKAKEGMQKMPRVSSGGEEEFYLERID